MAQAEAAIERSWLKLVDGYELSGASNPTLPVRAEEEMNALIRWR
jgi:hypothetical protein